EARLNRVGCFRFEPVRGAAANELPGAVPDEVKEERFHRFMAVQQEISRDLLQRWIGRDLDVLIDDVDEDGAVGRCYADAPEIDGAVILEGETSLDVGDMVRARITGADEYDLWGERI
ncbi:MAG: 30S ribosomal protein S12 methylthiotransferase RimO, partial [Parvularculaceae bacterium]